MITPKFIAALAGVAVFAWAAPPLPHFSISHGDAKPPVRWKTLVMAVVGVVAGLALSNPLAAALAVFLAALFDRKCRAMEERDRRALLDSQAEVALQMVAALHQATGDLIGALDKAAECVSDPLSAELKKTVADYRTGASIGEALRGLAERVPSQDVRAFVDGVLEAERFGADAGTVVAAVVETIRDRMNLREEMKNEMRGQRLTINALLLLLPLMTGMAFFLFPQSQEILAHTLTGKLIVCGVFLAEYFVWALSTREAVGEW
ncbi:type II secretion system F family protein [Neomoorella thermoacetica]|uniref:type II secretion system F family protein n=1 Tax=Neomoorella thermoacetica TaxID=1525 RepID=UPI0030CFD97F